MENHQQRSTANNDRVSGLRKTVLKLFSGKELRNKGFNLNGNQGNKKGLIDFLSCIPKILEQTMAMNNLSISFVETGMTDKETKISPTLTAWLGRASAGYQ